VLVGGEVHERMLVFGEELSHALKIVGHNCL
jgi:hypothetical protein